MKKFAVVADFTKQTVAQAIQNTRSWLEKTVKIIGWYQTPEELHRDLQGQDIDCVFVFGGDGLLLSVARQLNGKYIPVLGVNFGKLGFLAEVTLDEFKCSINEILSGNYSIQERMMLSCKIVRNNQEVISTLALNDGVVKSASSRMLYCRISIDNQVVSNFGGDGIIISTPIGSTAYCLSAGGPVLSPALSGLVITPICPHTLTMRPMIVPSHHKIEICCIPPYPGQITFSADGQVDFTLQEQDLVYITQAQQNFYILEARRRNFFKILQEKLAWGQQRQTENL